MARLFAFVLLLAALRTCEASSWDGFKAGYINAMTTTSEAIVEIVVVFNNSYVACNNETIGTVVLANATVTCLGGGCPTAGIDMICTDFSEFEGYTLTKGRYRAPSTTGLTIALETHYGDASIQMKSGNHRYVYTDLSAGKRSPNLGHMLVQTVIKGCSYDFVLAVDDLDDGKVLCKLDRDKSADFNETLDGVRIIEQPCAIVVDTNLVPGDYALVLRIEREGDNVSQPLHVLLRVIPFDKPCNAKPRTKQPSPTEKCYQLFEGDVFSEGITGRSPVFELNLKEIRTTLLYGMKKSSMKNDDGTFSVDVEYNTSSVEHYVPGGKPLCYTFKDVAGYETLPACSLIVPFDDEIKKLISWTPKPPASPKLGSDITMVFTSVYRVTMRSQQEQTGFVYLYLASNDALVKKYPLSDTQIVSLSGRDMAVTFPADLFQENTYYVTLDRGAAKLKQNGCVFLSLELKDKSASFTVLDFRPPGISFVSSFTFSNTGNVTIVWNVNKTVVSSKCVIVNAANVPSSSNCSNQWMMTGLTDGDYSLTVTVEDKIGMNSSAVYKWTVDVTPPNVTCQKLPEAVSKNTSVDVICTCNEKCSAECRVIKKIQPTDPFIPCSTIAKELISYSSGSLSDKETYALEVKALDEYNNTKLYQFEWKTDFKSPKITCQKLPAAISKNASVAMMCTCNEDCSAVCSIHKKTQPEQLNSCSNMTGEFILYSAIGLLGNETYEFVVKATDRAGNMGIMGFEWKTDFIKPNVTITQPKSPSNDRIIDIEFTCDESCTAKCSLQNGNTPAGMLDCGGQLSMATKTYRTPSLSSAMNYTFKVIPTDRAGNEGDLQEVTWLTDMDGPNCTIIGKPSSKTNETVSEFKFSCNEPSTTKCSLTKQGEDSNFTDCGGSLSMTLKTYTTPTLVTTTTYVFVMYGIDALGNNGTNVTYTWITDFIKPILTITQKPTSPNKNRNVDIKFSCNELCTTQCVLQNGSSSSGSGECGGQLSMDTKTFTTPDLVSAVKYTFKVIPTDCAGNAGDPVEFTWLTDMDVPICTITLKPALISNQTVSELRFTCNEPSTTKCSVKKQGEDASFIDCGGNSSVVQKSLTTPTLITTIEYVFKMFGTDIAGNNGLVQTYQWGTDFVKPVCTFTKIPPKNSSETSVELTISCNEATRLRCTIQKGNLDPVVRTCGDDLSTATRKFITLRLESEYMYKFTVYSTDAAGNEGDSISTQWYTVIKTILTATINLKTSGNVNSHTAFQSYANQVTAPLKASRISRFRTPILTVDYDVDKKNWNHVYRMLESGTVTVEGVIVPITSVQLHKKDGSVVQITLSVNPCVVYEEYYTCPVAAPCVEDDGWSAKCSSEFIETSRGVIALAAGIGVFFFLLAAVSLTIYFWKNAKNVAEKKHVQRGHEHNNSSRRAPWSQPRFYKDRFLTPDKHYDNNMIGGY